jgi:hypothetical protein
MELFYCLLHRDTLGPLPAGNLGNTKWPVATSPKERIVLYPLCHGSWASLLFALPMDPSTSKTQALAQRLVELEARTRKADDSKAPGAFSICEMLRPQLATLMGGVGFRVLLSRALVVAQADDPWLHTVQVEDDGTLSARDEAAALKNPEAMARGSVVLVSHLLGLMVAFIGEALTLRLVLQVWPTLSFDELDSRKGDKK